MSDVLIWVGVAVICAVVEMITLDLIFIMLAGGAIGAAATAGLGVNLPLQLVVAAVISIALLVGVRPAALRHMRRQTPETNTNVDALIGQTVTVTSTVTEAGGLVRVGGEVWSALAVASGTRLPVGSQAVVTGIRGVALLVSAAAGPTPE